MSTATYAPFTSKNNGGHIRGSSDDKPLEEGTIISCMIFLSECDVCSRNFRLTYGISPVCLILAVLVRQYYLGIMPRPQRMEPWQKAVMKRRQAKLNARRRSQIKAGFNRVLKPLQDLIWKWAVPIVRWQVRAGISSLRRAVGYVELTAHPEPPSIKLPPICTRADGRWWSSWANDENHHHAPYYSPIALSPHFLAANVVEVEQMDVDSDDTETDSDPMESD